MSMIAQDERECRIIQLAQKLLGRTVDQTSAGAKLIYAYAQTEADIDAAFIYRFDPALSKQIDQTRAMMRALIRQDGSDPLSGDDAARWAVHLETNRDLQISVGSNDRIAITTRRGGYSCLDRELAQAYGHSLSDPAETKRLLYLMVGEANQTSKVWSNITGIGRNYGVIPCEISQEFYSKHDVELRTQSLIEWIIRAEVVPSFLDEVMDVHDQRIGKGVVSTICPQRWQRGQWHVANNYETTWQYVSDDTEKTYRDVRVRTWAIYYLTRRGGGRLTEQEAIKKWYEPMKIAEQDMLRLAVYQRQRDKLLAGGSSKDHRI